MAELIKWLVSCFPSKHANIFGCRSCSVSGPVSSGSSVAAHSTDNQPVHSASPRDTSRSWVTPEASSRRQGKRLRGSMCFLWNIQLMKFLIRTAGKDITSSTL